MNWQTVDSDHSKPHDLSCVVLSVGPTKFHDTSGKPSNTCELRDNAGVVKKVKVRQGFNPPLTQGHVGQSLIFNAQWNYYETKSVVWYMVFWQCPNPQEVQPQTPQAPPQQQNYQPPAQTPPQQQSQPQEPQRNMTYAYESAPHVQASIQRSVAVEAASRWAIGKAECTAFDILNVAITLYDWLSTGNVPMQAAPEPGREPGEDDESAF